MGLSTNLSNKFYNENKSFIFPFFNKKLQKIFSVMDEEDENNIYYFGSFKDIKYISFYYIFFSGIFYTFILFLGTRLFQLLLFFIDVIYHDKDINNFNYIIGSHIFGYNFDFLNNYTNYINYILYPAIVCIFVLIFKILKFYFSVAKDDRFFGISNLYFYVYDVNLDFDKVGKKKFLLSTLLNMVILSKSNGFYYEFYFSDKVKYSIFRHKRCSILEEKLKNYIKN